jgi:hypothetical protein
MHGCHGLVVLDLTMVRLREGTGAMVWSYST